MQACKEGNEPLFGAEALLDLLFSVGSTCLTISDSLLGHSESNFPICKMGR